MQRDFRHNRLYSEVERFYRTIRRPGAGVISDASDVHASGTQVAFAGAIVDTLEGLPPTRVCVADLNTGASRVMTCGPNSDRAPKFSPDGQSIAFLSDRHAPGDFQLYLLDLRSGAARPTPRVEGWVESVQWAPNGKRILLGVAGHGADIAGGQGAITTRQMIEPLPSWIPSVESGDESHHWRSAWVYETQPHSVFRATPRDLNVWDAAWCGDDALVIITSKGPSEGLWYSALAYLLDLQNGQTREIYRPRAQLGQPAASPCGRWLAFVDAICSDRGVVAGELKLVETSSGRVIPIHTNGVDITHTEWRSSRRLLLAGHRGFESVAGLLDVDSGMFRETWSSSDISSSGMFNAVAGVGEHGDFVLIGEGFQRAPELAVVRDGCYRTLGSFDQGYSEYARCIASVERITWRTPDSLEIQGWFLRPMGTGPFPTVLNVHGGPVWHWHPTWLGRAVRAPILLLVQRGYAVFLPNPRGSTARGQDFVRPILGDVGGADTYDHLSGLDHLVATGIADSTRLGVTGGSYGGFMASWLITQDARFAAAVPVAPVTNQVTAHLISNIPQYVRLSLNDKYFNPGGRYFERSPVMHAHKTGTPTLSVCGALDRCTPPEEAVQFHHALLENGVKSVLVTYPEEGHGIRKWPATIDYAARLIAWFEECMGATT
jgi:dipeptidyl aminopeptidase/acylaminoacyl peptidase